MTNTPDKTIQVLQQVATLVGAGLPAPTSVTFAGRPAVLVRGTDLADWLIALELPLPTWAPDRDDDTWEHATWPAGTFAEEPFEIRAVRRIDTEVPC